ncbi:MAG: insulinase family protein [Ignavibacteriaceae bacterium]|nr:insulinase family protein [Ignavibacteriaceae bacterium]
MFKQISKIYLIIFVLIMATVTNAGKYDEGKVYRHQLANGMVVLTMERHLAPLIYHQLTYRVGSRNEHRGITGISHVVEHMMFKGTPKYGKGMASKTITQNSGIFNAFTANDMTSYYEYLPKNKIEVAFDIESDRMMNSDFNEDEFKSEIEVIIQERRMRTESQVSGVLREQLNAMAYTFSPNRDPVIGWAQDLRSMTREQAYNYYKTYYTPNNAFLVLVGDFNTDEILKKVEQYYGKIPRGPEVKGFTVPIEEQIARKEMTLYHGDITEPGLRMVFHVPNYLDPDAAALRLGGQILAERSRDARLHKRLVEGLQIATGASGGFGMSLDPSLFQISAGVKPGFTVDTVEKVIWDEIAKIQNEPVTDNELQKVKNKYKFIQVTEYTKNADIGTRISRYEAFFGWDFFAEFEKRVLAITKDDIQRVMKKYFSPEKVNVVYTYPKEGAEKKKSSAPEDEEGESGKTEDPEGIHLTDDVCYYTGEPLSQIELLEKKFMGDDEVIAPSPIAPTIKTMKLKNGVTLYAIENHLSPSISIVGTFETGYMPEVLEGAKPGLSSFMAAVMNRGTKDMTYTQLAERLAFVPYQFAVTGSYKAFYFQGFSLLENADEMMKTGYSMVVEPPFRQEDFDKIKPRELLAAKNRFKKTGIKAFYYMFNKMFEGHPVSQNSSTEASIKSITIEDMKALHKKYLVPSNLSILMIGDMTPEQMKDLANKYFGSWKNDQKPPKIMDLPEVKDLKGKEIKAFTSKESTECTINIGFTPTNDCAPEEAEALAVMNHILAASALTSRMGIELRDKQGLIYGIKSELWSQSEGFGYWKFNTKTGPQNTGKVITGIFKEIKKFIEDGITDEELAAAKKRQIGLLPFYVETPDDAAQIVFDMLKDKKPLDYFDKKAQRIQAVTKADVIRMAKKYLTVDKFIIVVDGPVEQKDLDPILLEL